ncbi:MAG: arabinogalactan endo-1,4-beta-galactosidase [Bacteroidales bacterium]|nr:arabinogalactan endo-1,4-beta-galactosidase [Bacteroidales bacterium]
MRTGLACLLALCALVPACRKADGGGTEPEPPARTFVQGVDISWTTELESKGYRFYNAAGQERECLTLMKEIGADAVRLRVWVDPEDGWNGQEDVLEKAKRAQALGLGVQVDFHYSDSWADPAQQTVPAAWKGKDAAAMATAVKTHTQQVLQALKSAGVEVDWVQVGNEVTNGMLWDSGRVAGTSAGQFVKYFQAGREAVKAVYPQAQVILHLDNGWNLSTLNWFLTLMKGNGLEYDLLGLSLYPSYWENGAYPDWKPRVQQFVSNLPTLYKAYGKPVMLVEFGMPASEPAKARAALEYLLGNTQDLEYFLGVFYWEPEAEHDRCGYDYGAFSGGRPTEALAPFGQY